MDQQKQCLQQSLHCSWRWLTHLRLHGSLGMATCKPAEANHVLHNELLAKAAQILHSVLA